VFAKRQCTGCHQAEFLGYPPTGKQVTWLGAGRFLFKDGKVIDLGVLGDLKALEVQLANDGA
jgi:predicted ester cyclase